MAKTFLTQLTNAAQTVTYSSNGALVSESRRMDVRVIVPDVPGDYPVVFYSHGHSANPAGAGSLNAKAIADQGYIVILPTHLDSAANPASIRNAYPFENPASTLHRIADIQHAFDQLPQLMAAAAGYAALTTIPVIAGHSHGSRVASLLAGATTGDPIYDDPQAGNPYGLEAVADARFRGAVLLSPAGIGDPSAPGQKFMADSWSRFDLPALMLTGTLDTTPVEDDYVARLDGFGLAPGAGKHAVVLEGADHTDIGGFSATQEQTAAIAQAVAAFLDAYVRGGANALNDPASFLAANAQFREIYARSAGVNLGAAQGGAAGDTIQGFGTDDSISGLAGADSLVGGDGADLVLGGSGDDSIYGETGNDFMYGGDNNDFILGQSGSDYLDGQGENDSLYGGDNNDTIVGNIGEDYLDGQGENDALYGNDGRDTLVGNHGNDYLDGGDGRDELYGNDSNDTLFGNLGEDYLDGQGENDVLNGGSGNDTLFGNIGQDQLWGGIGTDSLIGGLGDDQFRFALADLQAGVRDVIADFAEAGGNADLLVFYGVAAGAVTTSAAAGGTLVSIAVAGGTAEILVQSFTPAQLADQIFFL